MNQSFTTKKEMQFYKCEICGNVIIKLHDSGIIPHCCSRIMTKLIPDNLDGSLEKHIPVWKLSGNNIEIRIGEKEHPMETDHYIEWIFLKTNIGFHSKFLSSNCNPEACFKLCPGERPEYIYCYCNLHGIWKSCVDEGC